MTDERAGSATATWRGIIAALLTRGREVTQEGRAHEPRSRTTREIVGHQSRWDMTRAVVACPLRRVGYRFLAAEPAWIISGGNELALIEPFARHMRNFSDDGERLSGAYGPKFADQVSHVVGALRADARSRQAVASLWRERPGPSRDVPCTLSLQWLLRDGVLDCVATMRSSDAWLGVVYDVHAFSMMSAVVALGLRGHHEAHLGELVLTCGSQHIYKIDWEAAARCAEETAVVVDPEPLDLSEFAGARDLVDHLWSVARRDWSGHAYLSELLSLGDQP